MMEQHSADQGAGTSTFGAQPIASEQAREPQQRGPAQADAEFHEWLEYLAGNNYPLDATALAMLQGGVAAGYEAYLRSMDADELVIMPRTWAANPESMEYRRRLGFFRSSVLEAVRANRGTPIKGLVTGPFEDCAPNEEPPQGVEE